MRNALLSICFGALIAPCAFAQVDYSKENNTNPYIRYEYKSAEEWRYLEQVKRQQKEAEALAASQPVEGINYFSNALQNPIKISGKGNYKHLMANSAKIGQCWDKAAAAYKLDPWLLMAIAKTESSFNHAAINVNKNKSVDVGMMQINTIWLPTLQKFGIYREHLFDPCTSIFVGAWIMAQNIKNFGYNQDGIGAYNSPRNVTIRRNYAKKVYANYHQIVNDLYKKR